jgi:hypothetical protein
VRLTRRQLVARGAVAALASLGAALGIRRLENGSNVAAPLAPSGRDRHLEQHLLPNPKVVRHEGVEVLVPPLHHRVVTAQLKVDPTEAAMRDARAELESALAKIDALHAASRLGLGVTVAWGLPYFHRFVPGQTRRELPIDRRASSDSRTVHVLEHAERFPSDHVDTILEHNDIVFLLRSDDPDLVEEAHQRLSDDLTDILSITSLRTGVVGGGFDGAESLPNRIATAAKVPGADLMPRNAELFLGFTSTAKASLGPPKIVNFETLGYASLPSRYFVGGTHMHLSHLNEDLLKWYLDFDHRERAQSMFRPGLKVPPGRQTVPESGDDVETIQEVHDDYARYKRIGHAGAIQAASRLDRDVVAPDGTVYRKGTAVPQRADFNTIDNPFAWSSEPVHDRMSATPRAGVHFVVFNPTSDDFRRVRLAMDGILPDGTRLTFRSTFPEGLNSVLRTTHRQNFLVPPRAHRSLPLSELRA